MKGLIGSLQDHSNLRFLEIAPEILFGWDPKNGEPLSDVLPLSVSDLTLRFEYGDWTEQLRNFDDIKTVRELRCKGRKLGNGQVESAGRL